MYRVFATPQWLFWITGLSGAVAPGTCAPAQLMMMVMSMCVCVCVCVCVRARALPQGAAWAQQFAKDLEAVAAYDAAVAADPVNGPKVAVA